MKSKEKDIYGEARRRTVENAKGCFFQIANKPTWTRMDCQYFGCLRVQTGCDILQQIKRLLTKGVSHD